MKIVFSLFISILLSKGLYSLNQYSKTEDSIYNQTSSYPKSKFKLYLNLYKNEENDIEKKAILGNLQKLSSIINEDSIYFEFYRLISKYYILKLDSIKSLNFSNKAYSYAIKLNDKIKQIDILINISAFYARRENFEMSKVFNNKIFEIIISLNNHDISEIATFYRVKSTMHYQKKEADSGIFWLLKSLKIADKINDEKNLLLIKYNLGYTYLENSNLDLASTNLNSALILSRKLNDEFLYAEICRVLGKLHFIRNNSTKAIFHFENSLVFFEKAKYNEYIYEINKNLAQLYSKLNYKSKALKSINKSIKSANGLKNSKYILWSNISYAEVLFNLKEYKQAEDKLSKLLIDSLLNEEFDLKDKIEVYELFSKINFAQKKYKEAFNNLEILLTFKDSLSKKFINDKTHEIETRYQTEKKEAEILRLNNENLTTQVKLNKESRLKWIFGVILVMSLIGLGVFWKLYGKIKNQKEYIENLQKELHHRIKNNLSIINKFINDIKTKGNSEHIEANLTELQNKIESINTVHKQLYESHGIGNLNLKEYVNSLSENISKSFNLAIDYKIEIDQNLEAPIEKSFPLGLIINEFITNSYKYAFDTTSQPSISVHAKKNKDNKICIELSDNGIGFDVDTVSKNTLGLRLIHLLGRQMDADCVFNNQGETKLTLNF